MEFKEIKALKGVKRYHILTSHLLPLTSFYYLCKRI